jgi:hypothetical protein
MAVIIGAVLVSVSGAATTQAQKVTKIDVSTRAAVIHYLRAIHVNPKGAVIERGSRNYAGRTCPGKHWTCASTKHAVVQIAKKAGQNRFVCKSSKCVVVQFSGVARGVYIRGRSLAATSASPPGTQTAICIIISPLSQSCSIYQASATKNNVAVVYESEPRLGSTQSAAATASITQQSTGATTGNTACVTQNVYLDGSTVGAKGKSVTVALQAHQSVTIKQDASGSGGNSAVNGAKWTGSCDTTKLGQSQTLTSTATGSSSITQNEDNVYSACGDGRTGEYANLCLDVEQNQGIAHGSTTSGKNAATFTQTSSQTAIANTAAGPVTQTQSTPLCGSTGAPANCIFPGGLVGTINQDSSVSSSANASQVETQCEDAAKSGLSQCHTGSGDQDFNGSYALTQNQYGPEGVAKLPYHGNRRVPSRTGKGLGASIQTGGSGNQFSVSQTSTQDNDHVAGTQLNSSQADCASGGVNGSCTAGQTTTLNGQGTNDGYTSPTISNLTINCTNGQSTCVATPPPVPAFVSGPSSPHPSSSAAFNFTDTATGGVHFLCKIDGGTPQTCSSGIPFVQGYGPHTFQVAASDGHGNVSAYVPTTPFSWTNVPPDPTITPSSEPTNPEPWGNTDTFTFSDAESPVHFQCTLDGNTTPCNTGSISYTDLPSGKHSFSVRAYDTTDTYGSIHSASYTWVITPPDPTITPSSEPTNPEPWGNTDAFTFSDADLSVHFQCTLDGNTTGCNTGSISYTDLPSGKHTFSVRAYDATDTYASIHSASYTWVITPPDPTITLSSEPPNPDFSGNSYTLAFTDLDSTVHYQCQIDSQTPTACNSGSASYSGLDPGSHTFSVTAYDQSDTYASNDPATYTWTILPLAVSALGGADGSSAGWACQPGGPIALTVGSTAYDPETNVGTFAQIAITDVGGTAIDGLSAPTFTTDNYNAGSPRFVIDLSNGDSLWGYPPNAGLNASDFAWAINNGNTYQPWSDVQSAESGTTVVDAVVIADGDQDPGTTDKISDLTFNGTDFNSGTCPAPPAP